MRFGCLGVSNAIWDKPGPLSASEWERVRLHPHLTERMLQSSLALAEVARIAGQVRERLDGSGYPRGLSGASVTRPARVLAAADVYQSMLEPRPHRPAWTGGDAAVELRREVSAGRLDAAAVEAVLVAGGHRASRRIEYPGGLTQREVEVLRLIARGCTTKDVAARLVISRKTAGTHIEHIYAKLGVTGRVEASLFATQHGLLPEGLAETEGDACTSSTPR
jgi:DNA-binding CsgD family transcriptional regulator